MDVSTAGHFGEEELSARNANADTLSGRDADAWEEAVEWGALDFGALYPPDWRMTTAPDFD